MKNYYLWLLAFFVGWQVNAQTDITFGSGTNLGNKYPVAPYFGYSMSQQILTPGDIGQRCTINKIRFYHNGTTIPNSTEWVVYLAHTTKASFTSTTDWIPAGDLVKVYEGTITPLTAAGWLEITLTTPFVYNNTDNLAVVVDENKSSYDGTSSTNHFRITTSTYTNRGLYYNNDSTNPNPLNIGALSGNRTDYLSQMQFEVTAAPALADCETPSVVTGVTYASVTTTGLSGTITAPAVVPSRYLVVRSTSATAPSPVNGTVYSVGSTALGSETNVRAYSVSNTFTETGLTVGTVYYYHVFSANTDCNGAPVYSAAQSSSQATLCTVQATTLASSNITSNSAQVSWTATGTGSYILEYGPTGFTPGTGAAAGTNGVIVSSNAVSPVVINGLSPITTYQFVVRQVCTNGGYSANSSTSSFTTACAAVTTFPAVEPFATATPACWIKGKGGSDTTGPNTMAGSNWGVDGFANVGSTGAIRINIDSTGDNEWMISPNYQIPAGFRLTYKVAANQYNATTAPTTAWEADDFVKFMYSQDGITWTTLMTYNAANVPSHTGQTEYIDISSLAGQTVRFAFWGVEGSSNGSADIDFSLDDFTVEALPSCLNVSGITFTKLTDTTAQVSWTGGAGVVEWGVPSCVAGTGASAGACGNVVSGTSPQIITGLIPNTTYAVYVRQDCTASSNGYSANLAASYLNPAICLNTWTEVSSFPYNISGQTTCGLGNNVTPTNVAVVAGNASYFNGEDKVYVVHPDQTTSYIITLTTGTDQDGGFSLYKGCPYEASTSVVGFVQTSTGLTKTLQVTLEAGEVYYLIVDNWPSPVCLTTYSLDITKLSAPVCVGTTVPANAATNVVRNTTISWTAVANATDYDVYFGTSATPELVTSTTTNLTYTPSLLSANTTYYFQVIAKNVIGSAVGCQVYSFTTGSSFNYCIPTYTSGPGTTDRVVNVSLNELNNASAGSSSPYHTFYNTVTVPTIHSGTQATVAVTYGSNGSQFGAVWIDFNQNGTFEAVEGKSIATSAGADGTANFVFDVPANAVLGQTRMRVRGGDDSVVPVTGACGTASWGETEDYIVNIAEMPADLPDYVNLQYPATATILRGDSVTVYAQVYEPGVTDVNSDAQAGIEAWIGISPIGQNTDPATWTTWIPATFNVNVGNNDEYMATIGSNLAVGTYYYASRFRLNGGAFVYGGNPYNQWDGTTSISGVLTVEPNPTQCATVISPINAATGIAKGNVTLTWSAPTSGPAPTGYKVYFGTTEAGMTLRTTTSATVFTYSVSAPAYQTTYYWRIVPTSTIGGDAVGCSTISFTTEADPFAPYCSTGVTFASGIETITSVEFAGINNQSPASDVGAPALENFISISGNVVTESTYPMTLKGNTEGSFTNHFRVFIDWNADGDFDDAGESIPGGSINNSSGTDAVSSVINITVPANAFIGSTRMRIVKVFGSTAPTTWSACSLTGYGQAEDYTLNITACTAQIWYADADGDGFGNADVSVSACHAPAGYVADNTDCNDAASAVNPAASEVLYNGIDDNCDGNLDEGHQILSKVIASQCGTTLTVLNSLIQVESKSQATAYRYRVQKMVAGAPVGAPQMLERPYPHFTLEMLSSYEYASVYQIEVEVQRNGIWLGYYGAPCLVATPAVLEEGGAAQINPSTCGTVIPTISSLIYTTSMRGATGYRFRVTNLTNAAIAPQVIDRPLHWFALTMLSSYNYGTDYMIEVAVKTTGDYSGFGSPCIMSTPMAPMITSCDAIIALPTTYVYTSSMNKATSYRFELSLLDEFDQPIGSTLVDRPYHYFNFNQVPGYVSGGRYMVRVAVMTGGSWSPFGDACIVTAPGIARALQGSEEGLSSYFNAVAFPNPYVESFALNLESASPEKVGVKVYDMTGKLLEDRTFEATQVELAQFGERYPAGVYNIVLTQGANVKTLRVIKR